MWPSPRRSVRGARRGRDACVRANDRFVDLLRFAAFALWLQLPRLSKNDGRSMPLSVQCRCKSSQICLALIISLPAPTRAGSVLSTQLFKRPCSSKTTAHRSETCRRPRSSRLRSARMRDAFGGQSTSLCSQSENSFATMLSHLRRGRPSCRPCTCLGRER